ncbi:MAG: DUF4440 domain-containing protein [Bacteroidia bacterium]|nr:DUF4440 domain-containing protein [Bacteroidia bacterium]
MNKIYTIFIAIVLIHSTCLGQKQDVSNDFDSNYNDHVIGVSSNGIIKGKEAMKAHFLELIENEGALLNSKRHFRISVMENLDYEIGSFQTENGSGFAYLAIIEKKNGLEKRNFEVLYKVSSTNEIPKEITQAREKWIELCNLHNATNLVQELYTDDAIYFNRGRLLIGHDQLSQEYAYMNSPSYKLHLEPKHVEMVTDDIAFEIGQCSGSYPLPYMLVWKKQADGSWKIYLDSNY